MVAINVSVVRSARLDTHTIHGLAVQICGYSRAQPNVIVFVLPAFQLAVKPNCVDEALCPETA